MKKFAIMTALAAVFLGACDTTRMAVTTDDVYADPAEERKREAAIAAEQRKQEAIAREEALAREKEEAERQNVANNSEDSSPYYKDPEYRSEDYYDYEYSSRINRFYRPIGVGYYDNYYTNYYTYNQNPAFYGTSIYSSYGYGMPSQQFSSISFGISSGWGYGGGWNNCYNNFGYAPYDPWCGNYGYYNGWNYGYGYNNWGYMNGYNQGYYNGYYQGYNNAQWGYYNRYDVNSNYSKMEYAPRGTNTGGNSRNRSNPGEQVYRSDGEQKYFQTVAEEQNSRPRFSNSQRVMRNNNNQTATPARNSNNGSEPAVVPAEQPRQNTRNRNSNRVMRNEGQNNSNQNNQSQRRSEPVFNNNTGGNSGGGGSTPAPRNSGGGGTRRR